MSVTKSRKENENENEKERATKRKANKSWTCLQKGDNRDPKHASYKTQKVVSFQVPIALVALFSSRWLW